MHQTLVMNIVLFVLFSYHIQYHIFQVARLFKKFYLHLRDFSLTSHHIQLCFLGMSMKCETLFKFITRYECCVEVGIPVQYSSLSV